jgi:hypothetical protein
MLTECSYSKSAAGPLVRIGQVSYKPQGWPSTPPRLPVAPLPRTRRPATAMADCAEFVRWSARPDLWRPRYALVFVGKVPTHDIDIDEFRSFYNIIERPTDRIDLDSFVHMISQANSWWE